MFIESKKFESQVEMFFSFLTHEYNFKINKKEFSEYGDRIIYDSPLCRVSIVTERGQMLVGLSPADRFDQEIDLGHIILYKDPNSNFEYAFESPDYIEKEPIRLATLLRKYCPGILMGDFSSWPQIIKFREDWAKKKFGPTPSA